MLTLGLGMVACVDPEHPSVSRGMVLAREEVDAVTDAGLEHVDNGDGTWSYELPADFDPDVLVRGRILTWQYASQARYSDAAQVAETFRFVEQAEHEVGWRERFLGGVRVDAVGRRWTVVDVDQAALERVLEGPVTEVYSEGNDEDAGQEIIWTPYAWDNVNCDNDSSDDINRWNGDDRELVACRFSCDDDGPFYDQDCCPGETDEDEMLPNDRQRAAVRIENRFPGNLWGVGCSGVLVRNMFVLTAAHCVSDNNNNPVDSNDRRVCRWDDDELCNGVISIEFMDSYGGGSGEGGGTDFDDDWAILELEDPWTDLGMTEPQTMNLSSQSDSQLSAIAKVYNLANPGFGPSCVQPGNTSGGALYSLLEDEPIAGIYNDHLRYKIDGGPGASGSPFYSCPAGSSWFCSEGEDGVVFGVQAGFNTFNNRIVGPKVPHDREIMIGFIED